MKKLYALFIIGMLGTSLMNANPVASSTAQTVAQNFYSLRTNQPVNSVSLAYTEVSDIWQPVYYVFNINENMGFVIVSAEDATHPILGYSTEGKFVIPDQETNIGYWMQSKKNEILSVRSNANLAGTVIANEWHSYQNNKEPLNTHQALSAVLPLCQTTWNQSPYYNDLCPGGSVTGCVATAMAQIMKYWNYPAHGIDSNCYTHHTYGLLCQNFDTANFNWAAMPNNVTSPNSWVALLMYDCGVSVNMQYSPSGSGAVLEGGYASAEYSYPNFFGYDAATIAVNYLYSYSITGWNSLIENELNNSRPVQMAGGAHSWVCDGYDAINDFHMNWGWGGIDNGYFNMDSLNPYPYNFNSVARALTGIEPPPVLAYFTGSPNYGCSSVTVNFFDRSLIPSLAYPITSWQWTFPGGSPSSSTVQNPTVTYTTTGTYSVTLKVTNALGNNTYTANNYVKVGTLTAGITDAPRCAGSLILANPSDGISPYTYLWSTGSTASSVSGLSAGTYTLHVTDDFGCSATTSIVLGSYIPDVISTYAGNGVQGFSGDGGQAVNAEFNIPNDARKDASGNLYIADQNNNRIREIAPSGIITTYAGTGVAGFSGDGGPCTSAKLNQPEAIAFDASGNMYIAEAGNNRVRKITTGGIISTFAGNGAASYSGDGGAATSAEINDPQAVTFDAVGNLYIADYFNYRVRKVDLTGKITTIAGTGTSGFSGDGGQATSAKIYWPQGLVVDASGNIFISDDGNNRIRKVNTSGIISTYAGDGFGGFSGDGGPATLAEFNLTAGISMDVSGNLYVTDALNNRVRMVNTSGIINTVAGNGVSGFAGDGGLPVNAELKGPALAYIDPNGNLYIADEFNERIRIVSNVCMSAISLSVNAGSTCVNSSAIVLVNGGIAPFTYIWSNGTSNFSASNPTGNILSSGSYTVTVKDAGGDSVFTTTTITVPGALTVTRDSINAHAGCNGFAKINVGGGNPPYTYFWSPGGGTTDSIYNQCTGTYCCMVNDSKGCSDTVCINIFFTSVNSITDNLSIKLFPNPNKGQFTLETIGEPNGNSFVEIYNLFGEVLYSAHPSKSATGPSATYSINMNNASNGVYFYRLVNENGETSERGKFIIEK